MRGQGEHFELTFADFCRQFDNDESIPKIRKEPFVEVARKQVRLAHCEMKSLVIRKSVAR